VIQYFPEAFSEKKSICLNMLVEAAESINMDSYDILILYIDSLREWMNEFPDDIWAVMNAFFPFLKSKHDTSFSSMLWAELIQVFRINLRSLI
jgi:hypothetical protein